MVRRLWRSSLITAADVVEWPTTSPMTNTTEPSARVNASYQSPPVWASRTLAR